MKKNLVLFFSLSFLLFSMHFVACKSDKKAKGTQQYTCSMHPQVIKNEPGLCPICSMDLVPVKVSANTNEITLSESQIQLANIKAIKLARGDFQTATVLNARLVANPELEEVISSRYAGRIEQLYVKETGRSVSKGEPLFQIYSEQLQILQQDYLLQTKQAAAFPNEKIYVSLREAARNKLRLFGYTVAQIQKISQLNKTSPYVLVYAPSSGVVKEVSISEGQYVSEGSSVIRLQNLNQLWVEADVYPAEADLIKLGTQVKVAVNGFPELDQTVKISFVSPQIDPSSQILKVRANIQSKGKFQAGMQATVLLPKAGINNAVALPLNALVRNESGAQVWIKTGTNTFAPRMVSTGEEDENKVIITSGLENVKEVVISGAYLLSSEFILKKGGNPMAGHGM